MDRSSTAVFVLCVLVLVAGLVGLRWCGPATPSPGMQTVLTAAGYRRVFATVYTWRLCAGGETCEGFEATSADGRVVHGIVVGSEIRLDNQGW
jgi:polyferredoxin